MAIINAVVIVVAVVLSTPIPPPAKQNVAPSFCPFSWVQPLSWLLPVPFLPVPIMARVQLLISCSTKSVHKIVKGNDLPGSQPEQ